jgi:hypothetical protein
MDETVKASVRERRNKKKENSKQRGEERGYFRLLRDCGNAPPAQGVTKGE